jgi:hypothetical protein
MSSESDDPESTIPWPGFVDILSTVIIVFVFFMMMTSVIIFVLSEQAKQQAVSEAEKRAKSASEIDQKADKVSPDQAVLSPDISNLLHEKEALQKEVERLTQLKTVLSESEVQKATRDGDVLSITFGDFGASITPDTTEVIKQQLPYSGHVQIISYIPKGSDFASIREIALNRALNIRNTLLQGGIPNDHIALKILSQQNDDMKNKENFYGNITITFTP